VPHLSLDQRVAAEERAILHIYARFPDGCDTSPEWNDRHKAAGRLANAATFLRLYVECLLADPYSLSDFDYVKASFHDRAGLESAIRKQVQRVLNRVDELTAQANGILDGATFDDVPEMDQLHRENHRLMDEVLAPARQFLRRPRSSRPSPRPLGRRAVRRATVRGPPDDDRPRLVREAVARA
jgi:hypothetical protein